jgi:hypothetical protein
MKELLLSGTLVDVALSVIALEFVILVALRLHGLHGLRPLDLLGQLLAGAFLLLAVRCALRGSDYRWTLVMLTASFPAHAFDLARRARGQAPNESAVNPTRRPR